MSSDNTNQTLLNALLRAHKSGNDSRIKSSFILENHSVVKIAVLFFFSRICRAIHARLIKGINLSDQFKVATASDPPTESVNIYRAATPRRGI